MTDVVDLWLDAVAEAYSLAKGERSHQLRGRRVKFTDGRGLHPLSVAYGRIEVLFAASELPADVAVDVKDIRRAAEEDAEREFADEVREQGVAVFAAARAANRKD